MLGVCEVYCVSPQDSEPTQTLRHLPYVSIVRSEAHEMSTKQFNMTKPSKGRQSSLLLLLMLWCVRGCGWRWVPPWRLAMQTWRAGRRPSRTLKGAWPHNRCGRLPAAAPHVGDHLTGTRHADGLMGLVRHRRTMMHPLVQQAARVRCLQTLCCVLQSCRVSFVAVAVVIAVPQAELAALRASALDLQQREAALAAQQSAVSASEAAVTRERQMLARERQQLQVGQALSAGLPAPYCFQQQAACGGTAVRTPHLPHCSLIGRVSLHGTTCSLCSKAVCKRQQLVARLCVAAASRLQV